MTQRDLGSVCGCWRSGYRVRGEGVGSPLGSSSAVTPVFVVFEGVAGSAVELAFADGGFASVCPMVDMVDVAVFGWGVTAFPLAVAVAGDDRPALCGAPYSGFPADVEDLGVGSDDDPGDAGVAGDHAEGVDVDDLPVPCFVESSGDAL